MPDVVARLCRDGDTAPKLVIRSDGGKSGRKVWEVNTSDDDAVMDAIGLPPPLDPWSVRHSDCLLRSYSIDYLAGEFHRVSCEYATETSGGGGGGMPRPAPDVAYTIYQPAVTTITVNYALEGHGTTHAVNLPIANGDGAPKEVTGREITVVVFKAGATFNAAALATLVDLEGTVNESALVLPRIAGTAVDATWPAGTLRYRLTEIEPDGPLVKLSHHFVAARDHLYRWQKTDAKGLLLGAVEASRLYELAAFPASALR